VTKFAEKWVLQRCKSFSLFLILDYVGFSCVDFSSLDYCAYLIIDRNCGGFCVDFWT
jgi:hypothetical protein